LPHLLGKGKKNKKTSGVPHMKSWLSFLLHTIRKLNGVDELGQQLVFQVVQRKPINLVHKLPEINTEIKKKFKIDISSKKKKGKKIKNELEVAITLVRILDANVFKELYAVDEFIIKVRSCGSWPRRPVQQLCDVNPLIRISRADVLEMEKQRLHTGRAINR
jgi:hypothetical protein